MYLVTAKPLFKSLNDQISADDTFCSSVTSATRNHSSRMRTARFSSSGGGRSAHPTPTPCADPGWVCPTILGRRPWIQTPSVGRLSSPVDKHLRIYLGPNSFVGGKNNQIKVTKTAISFKQN